MKTSNFEYKTLQELANVAIEYLKDNVNNCACYGCDLHNDIFNQDYYIIGRYQAKQWLVANTGVFNAIGIVQEYEKDNFGEVNTDLSEAEKVVNMIVYIAGEEVLSESETLRDKWDDELSEEDVALCEFVCTSKQPLQKMLREGLETLRNS
jgi:hypothetical protein